MAQLPASMRRAKPATTSIHASPPKKVNKLLEWGSWFLLFFALLTVFFGGYAFYQRLSQAKIAHVYILGVPSDAEKYLNGYLQNDVKGNYFTTDLEKIRDQVLTLPWIDQVVVTRAWPNAVVVRVIPRHAIARWGTSRLLGDDGTVYQAFDQTANPNLPLLLGPITQAHEMMNKYHDVNVMFAPMHMHLKELYLTDRMTWFFQFDNGLRVVVDQDQTMSKLQRLHDLASSDLQPIWDKISAIDLRYRNGLALQWKSGQPVNIINGHFVVNPPTLTTTQTSQVKP